MTTILPSIDGKETGVLSRAMHHYWRLFLAEGIVLSLLGLAAIIIPPLAGVVVTIVLGWLFLVAGLIGVLATFGARHAPGFGWSLLSAFLALGAGALLLWNPLEGVVTITYVVTAFFIIDGIATIILAGAHRRELSDRWEWMMLNGVVDLVLAGIIIVGLPGTLDWALGLLVGIDMIFGGASLVGISLQARSTASV